MIGTTLNHYRIVKALGSGGMGDVYAAEDARLKRTVAIKVLPALVARDPERRDRFEREAQTIAALNHPNIVTIHSIEFAGDVPFLTMELVEGKTLAEIVPKGGLRAEKLLPIACALADAIAAAHQRGVVHRDLKPANVMITDDGRVKVLDFGLAKLKEDTAASAGATMMPTQALTGEGRIVGTVAYMAPEQAEGKTVDGRSDIFSLGVLLYELATGARPFTGETSLSILSSIIKDTPPSVTELNTALPKDLGRIVRHCLAKDPLRRYQSAVDLRNDLEELRQDVDSGTQVGALAPAVRPPPLSRVSLAIAAGLGAAIVGVGLAGYALWPGGPTRPATPTSTAAVRAVATSSPRVAVAVLENRTGDRSLDSVGSIAADSLIQGLTELSVIEVVPSPMTAAPGGEDGAAVARRTTDTSGATSLITGAYYLQGDEIEFQVRLVDAPGGKLLRALAPVSGPRAAPRAAIESVRQRVMGAAGMQFDPKMDWLRGRYEPAYEAYREFASGLELFGSNSAQAVQHFQRALDLDPQFVGARLIVAIAYGNERKYELAAATLGPLVEQRNRLDALDRLWVDWYQADLRGRHTEGLRYLLEAEKLAPQSFIVNYQVGNTQWRLNQPRSTLETFAKLPYPAWVTRLGTSGWRFNVAAAARHALTDYNGELQEARDAERVAPQSLPYRGVEARALIGLGRTADAMRIVDEILALPGSAGPTILDIARELRAHDHRQASLDLAQRTVSWYRNRAPDVAATESTRAGLANALYVAERWDEAREAFSALAEEFPDTIDYMGFLGALAARRGDRTEAMKWSGALRRIDRLYLFGSHTFWRGRIAALLGDSAAVDLLRDGFAQGLDFTIAIHRSMDFEPLASNAAFRELMRPKG